MSFGLAIGWTKEVTYMNKINLHCGKLVYEILENSKKCVLQMINGENVLFLIKPCKKCYEKLETINFDKSTNQSEKPLKTFFSASGDFIQTADVCSCDLKS